MRALSFHARKLHPSNNTLRNSSAQHLMFNERKMADRRRRRRATSTEDSDELSEGSEDEQPVEKTSDLLSQESAEEVPEKVVGESEYESAEEEDEVGPDTEKVDDSSSLNVVDEEGGEEEAADVSALGEFEGDIPVSNNGDEDDVDEEDEEEEWKDGEREQGDGEESQMQQGKEKPLDDDEDRTNPQYIPKKGGFYEHDDRLAALEEEEADDASTTSKKPKKKLWKDEGKWQHDRFKEYEQNPKARDELVAIYGYDIRDEDNAPRARRRRRYGRGPSKYTRKWDDEDAYGKLPARFPERGAGRSRGIPRGRGRGRGGFYNREDEFEEEYYDNEEGKPATVTAENKNEAEEWHKEEFPPLKAPMPPRDNRRDRPFPSGQRAPRDRGGRVRSRGPGRENWSGEDTRPFNNRGGRRDRQNAAQYASDYNSVEVVTKSFEKVAIKEVAREQRLGSDIAPKDTKDAVVPNQHHERRQATIPPRLQEVAAAAASRPKRYSSQRQRPAPETSAATSPTSMTANALSTSSANYQPPQAQTVNMPAQYFDPGFLPPVFPDNSAKPVPQQPGAQMLAQPYQGYPPAYQEPYGQTVIPPPYIAPSGMNYGPPPATYTQYPFQQFPGPHPPVSQAHEIFRGGVAYYTTQAQQPVRATLHKRPRAAIPIVAPPELEGRPRNPNMEDPKDQLELSLDENAGVEQIVEG